MPLDYHGPLKYNLVSSLFQNREGGAGPLSKSNPLENIIDIREYDVPYHVRVSIDRQVCVIVTA